MDKPQRPMFAQVGRPLAGQDSAGSRLFRALIAMGLLAAVITFFWEQAARVSWRVVEVTMMGAEAAEAEQALEVAP